MNTQHPRQVLGMDGEFELRTKPKLIRVEDLRLGMMVHELDKPWSDSGLLLDHFILTDEAQLRAIRAQCRHVLATDEASAAKVGQIAHAPCHC